MGATLGQGADFQSARAQSQARVRLCMRVCAYHHACTGHLRSSIAVCSTAFGRDVWDGADTPCPLAPLWRRNMLKIGKQKQQENGLPENPIVSLVEQADGLQRIEALQEDRSWDGGADRLGDEVVHARAHSAAPLWGWLAAIGVGLGFAGAPGQQRRRLPQGCEVARGVLPSRGRPPPLCPAVALGPWVGDRRHRSPR